MKDNQEILKDRISKFNHHTQIGPRVGDFLYIPSTDSRIPEYTRFTHDWDDHIQTGGSEHGSYHLRESGKLSYSGSLDPGISKKDLICTGNYKNGNVWFFDKDISGAGRGVTFSTEMMVYAVYEGAELSGLYHRDCPFYLTVLDQNAHAKTCGYWYVITKHGTSHTAFATEKDLTNWLENQSLSLTKLLTKAGELSWQSLAYKLVDLNS